MPERIVYVLYRFITAGKFHGDFPAVFSFSCITDVKTVSYTHLTLPTNSRV